MLKAEGPDGSGRRRAHAVHAGVVAACLAAAGVAAAPAPANLIEDLQRALQGQPPAPAKPPAPAPAPAAPAPAPVAPAPAPAQRPTAIRGGGRAGSRRARRFNPFERGQCTYHAYEKRPDVFERAVARGVPTARASRRSFAGVPDWWWNAWRWAGNARRAGIPTGKLPARGALAVFPRGYGGSPIGHVAYVRRVYRSGSYLVSERNWNHSSRVTRRRVAPHRKVRFIYGGPAGRGPTRNR